MATTIRADSIPKLVEGDRLTATEFERRHPASPHFWKAELIEGVVHVASEPAFDWFVHRGDRYDRIPLGKDGLYRSEVFPGLWLDPEALIRGDLAGVFGAVYRGLASPGHQRFVERLRAAAPH